MGLPSRPAGKDSQVADASLRWVEVWSDDAGYLLVVKARRDGRFEIFDPQEQKLDSEFAAYDQVVNELAQDEFAKIEGRQQFG